CNNVSRRYGANRRTEVVREGTSPMCRSCRRLPHWRRILPMKVHLVMAASAVSLLLTSAAFAASSHSGSTLGTERGSTGGEGTPRGGDRFTVMTDDEGLMCKVDGNPSGSTYAPPSALAASIEHQQQEGNIRCPAK